MKSILSILFFTFWGGMTCFAQPEQIGLSINGHSDVLDFAREELNLFLGKTYKLSGNSNPDWQLVLETDSKLTEGSFNIQHLKNGKQNQIILRGSNDAAVLHAVYTFLEKAGVRFEITGAFIPVKVDITQLAGYSETIHPKVKKRGIRQHINFPMDISSYPLNEAKEYIRNLARLRFNFITFHSYPGHWYGELLKNGTQGYGGHFFYGQRHDVPDTKFYHDKIRNKKTFCIPDIELYYDDDAVREKMAADWLRQVIEESKKVGLTVRFSFESRNSSPDINPTIATVKQILSLYPKIDEIEIITSETLGLGSPVKENVIKEKLEPLFGADIMKDPVLTKHFIYGNTGITELSANIGHNIKAIKAMEDDLFKEHGIKGCVGLYIVVPEMLETSFHLLRTYAPDIEYAVLPAHGSRRVAINIPHTLMTKKEWGKTTIYSWLEFDGSMYIQQNGIRGIRNLIEYAESVSGLDPIEGISFNHWRTAENVVTARYAAEATLLGSQDETAFYTRYAEVYGIKHPRVFTQAMQQLDAVDWYATSDLINVGFCAVGLWGRTGFGNFSRRKLANLMQARQMYEQTLEYIRECAPGTSSPNGKALIAFLDNRIRSTIVYLKAYEKGAQIQNFDQNNLTPEQRKAVAEYCNEGILGFEQYLNLFAEMLPDRGCEGTLISAYYTPIPVLRRIRFEYGDVPYDADPVAKKTIDPPPAPVKF